MTNATSPNVGRKPANFKAKTPKTPPPPTRDRVEFLVERWGLGDPDDLRDGGVKLTRAEVRNLRRALFGSAGLKDVPGKAGGPVELPLADGAELTLFYKPRAYRFDDASWVTVWLRGDEQ